MIVKNITQVGNSLIRKKVKRVVDPMAKTTQRIIKNLIDSIQHHELVGMAAPQIGENSRIFIIEIRETKLRKGDSKENIDQLRVFINPRIIRPLQKILPTAISAFLLQLRHISLHNSHYTASILSSHVAYVPCFARKSEIS